MDLRLTVTGPDALEAAPAEGIAAQTRRRAVSAAAATLVDALPPAALALRRAAFEALRHGAASTVAELATGTGVPESESARLLEAMAAMDLVALDADQVVGSTGLTTRSSDQVLVLDGIRLKSRPPKEPKP